jgi:ferredoxin
MVNFKKVTSAMGLLKIDGLFPDPGRYRIRFCNQCGECADACSVDAIELEDGIYRINEEECTACHACVDACPLSVMIITPENDIPAKCILCGECAAVCPRQAIVISRDETVEEKL